MKADTHPNYSKVQVNCTCGNSFETGSTEGKDISVYVKYPIAASIWTSDELMDGLKKIGASMLTDWQKAAGDDGAALLKAIGEDANRPASLAMLLLPVSSTSLL